MSKIVYLTTNKFKFKEAEIGDENPEEKASKYGNAIDQFAKWAKEKLQ